MIILLEYLRVFDVNLNNTPKDKIYTPFLAYIFTFHSIVFPEKYIILWPNFLYSKFSGKIRRHTRLSGIPPKQIN